MNSTLSFRKVPIQCASNASEQIGQPTNEAAENGALRSAGDQGHPSITTLITTIL